MAGCVHQDAREVKTKFSKTFTTCFLPVGDDARKIVADWVTYLRAEKRWGNEDPLSPRTLATVGSDARFVPSGLERAHWGDASPIRKVFRDAFTAAALPYFNPHSLRHTLVALGQKLCRGPEEFKAWSQNLGHEAVLTTFYSYGGLTIQRQGEILTGLRSTSRAGPEDREELIRKVVDALTKN